MRSPLPIKTKILLDMDNTLIDTLEIFGALNPILTKLSQKRRLPLNLVYEFTREASAEHRWGNFPALLDAMNLQPRFNSKSAADTEADNEAKRDWFNATKELSRFYTDTLPVLQHWHDSGTLVIMKTDTERLTVIRRIWLMALNATADHKLSSPYEIMPYYDHIYCTKSLDEPEDPQKLELFIRDYCEEMEVPPAFALELTKHMTALGGIKPSAHHRDVIYSDFPINPENVLYIGDSYKDGLEARIKDPIDFAWAKYGTNFSDNARALYEETGSKSYSYGTAEIQRRIWVDKIDVFATLENSLADVLNHFDFGKNELQERRSLEDIQTYERFARRNLADYRAVSLDLGQ